MPTPKIAKFKPYLVEAKKDKRYLWCSCGRSKTQPFCDGSHQGTGFLPVAYVASTDEDVLFCGCKHTATSPFCDGSHNNLLEEYPNDDAESPKNLLIPNIARTDGSRTMLDGGCFVVNPATMDGEQVDNLHLVELLSTGSGARYQSQYYALVHTGQSPVISFGKSHVVGFIVTGCGQLVISGKPFQIRSQVGFAVHPDETFQFEQQGTESLRMYLNICPIASDLDMRAVMRDNFVSEFPDRIAVIDPENAESMADRFFQVLIDKRQGCTSATQFIGEIPLSKAEPHRHLYEESIIVLSGSGAMWTEERKTKVSSGDVIFLPQKQLHSLQCTDANGMLVLGVIHPGDNPSINY